jgi:hypothetical protein
VSASRHHDTIAGVSVEQLERAFWLLREKLPLVLAANRYFEEQTGIHNEAGNNNLLDAFSHFATLVEKAEELRPEQQRDQVTHLEDHLRRSMMEAFEQVLKQRLGDVAPQWDAYVARVRPLQLAGELPGVASEAELGRLRRRIKVRLDRARASKRETTWEAWQRGTEELVEACDYVEQLETKLREGLAAADAHRRHAKGWRLGWWSLAIGVALAVGGIVIGILVG